MNQQQVGACLKELRQGKGLTQEQLAEQFGVSGRTVSRWETGVNLPDISLLMVIADFYDVEIIEILNGERISEKMTEETRETIQKVIEYTDADKALVLKRVKIASVVGLASLLFGFIMREIGPVGIPIYNCLSGMCIGLAIGAFIAIILYLNGTLFYLKTKKSKQMTIILVACIALMAICVIASIVITII